MAVAVVFPGLGSLRAISWTKYPPAVPGTLNKFHSTLAKILAVIVKFT